MSLNLFYKGTSAVCWVLLAWAGCLAARAQPLEPLSLEDFSEFTHFEGWTTAGAAWGLWDSDEIQLEPGAGIIVHDGDAEGQLRSKWEHGDLILELDYLLARGTESGVYLQGRYEVQIADSWGVREPALKDAGAVSPPANGGTLEGHVPRVNAAKAPGLWQHLRIVFVAPRFDDDGRKISNARFMEVIHNGVKIQEGVQVSGPTRDAPISEEGDSGPLMFEGHGPIAFRNIRIRHFEPVEPLKLSDARYTLYKGEFSSLEDLRSSEPSDSGEAAGYVWDLFGPTADRFGVEWNGTLHVPRTGEYEFAMRFNWIDEIPYDEDAVAGQGRILIDGTRVVEHDGADSTEFGRVHLSKGAHPFSMTYFKNRRLWRPIVFLRAKGPGMPIQNLNAERTLPDPETSYPPLHLDAASEPYVLRSFAEHDGEKRTNVANVGDPSGVHYALDLNTGDILYAWKGGFVDVGSMWTGRGEQQIAVPIGQRITVSKTSREGGNVRLEHYALDDSGYPTFTFASDGATVSDKVRPAREGRSLTRRLAFEGRAPLQVQIAEGSTVHERSDRIFDVDGEYFVELAPNTSGEIRSDGERSVLLVTVADSGGRSEIEYDVVW